MIVSIPQVFLKTIIWERGSIMDDKKVVSIENMGGFNEELLKNIMRMVPEKDRHDMALQRLLSFRLRIDGEGNTREYVMRKIRDMIQCRYNGRLYDYLKDDEVSRTCNEPGTESSDT